MANRTLKGIPVREFPRPGQIYDGCARERQAYWEAIRTERRERCRFFLMLSVLLAVAFLGWKLNTSWSVPGWRTRQPHPTASQ